MGFRLIPPTDSGLSLSLSVDLPLPKDWDLSASRIVEQATNLSGEYIYSARPKSVTILKPIYEQDIPEDTYTKLAALDNHATQAEWMAVIDGRTFRVIIDVTKATRIMKRSEKYRSVTMAIHIVSEETL